MGETENNNTPAITVTATTPPKKKWKKVIHDPAVFARLIMATCPQYLFNATAVKKAMPDLKMSVEKIKSLMDRPEFIDACRRITGVNEKQMGIMYDNIIKHAYEMSMNTDNVNVKFLEHIGIVASKFASRTNVAKKDTKKIDNKNLNELKEMVKEARRFEGGER